MRLGRLIALAVAFVLATGLVQARAEGRLVLATTTSTANSGLLDVLIPPFEKAANVKVHAIPVGTGKALALARRCDADVVMVHAPGLEKRFVQQGYGVKRLPLMHNYFVIVGPAEDPAQIKGAGEIPQAMGRIAKSKARFLSRGDKSGTNVKELALWKAAGIKPDWPGYQETGQGMGATLTMAGEMRAYTLSDIGTFLKYRNTKKLGLDVLLTQKRELKNPYSVIMVNPERCPHVNAKAAKAFINFLVSRQGQDLIKNYRAGGRQLFWPDARPGE